MTTPSWPQARYNAAQTGYNPNETQLNPGNVGTMVTRATATMAQTYSSATPVVAGGMVFDTSYTLGSARAQVQAFPENCGAPTGLSCNPLWSATVGKTASGAVTVADGEVFVDSDNAARTPSQELWVFPEHCGTGGGACSPKWKTTVPGAGVGSEASPTVSGTTVYVPGGQAGSAYLFAYPTTCTNACKPTWRGKMDIGDSLQSAAVADGFVYVPDYDGNIDAFKVGCATGGGTCSPAWQGNTGEFGPSGAAVSGGMVFVGSQNDDLFAFRATGCGSPTCSAVWTAVTGSNVRSDPAVANGEVYVTSDDGYLYAFPEKCAAITCTPTWKAFLTSGEDSGHSSPAVANGVVYVSWSNSVNTVGIDAFSATCNTGGGTCSPLWQGNGGTYYLLSGPVVVNGELWASGGPQNGPAVLYAFGLPVPRHA
ncbi:MAG TPA: PQQ-binding-like beta-propeller repeat protein [Streptosporangiaceae bacterium]|nr:PQQ-binding-like beta-propeller repeat protein [Streptosporangiaceae bacterium]